MQTVILIALSSIFAGIWGSLLGLGGGLILIPLLTMAFKIPIHTAIGASLVGVIATSTGSAITYVRQGKTDIRLGMTLELATTIGAITGALLAGYFSSQILYILFSVLLIYISFTMARKKETAATLAEEGRQAGLYKNLPVGMGASGIAGVISGLLGVGGGIIKIPTMYVLMGVPLPIAIATSNFMIGVTATASAIIYFNRGDIHPLVAVPVSIGIFAGAIIGSKLSHRIPKEFLRWLFVIVAVYTSLQMLFKGMGISIPFFGG